MAPAIESPSSAMLSPQRNVTFAVNYEVATVEHYWSKTPSRERGKKPESAPVAAGTGATLNNATTNSGRSTGSSFRSSDASCITTTSVNNQDNNNPSDKSIESDQIPTCPLPEESTKEQMVATDADSSNSVTDNPGKNMEKSDSKGIGIGSSDDGEASTRSAVSAGSSHSCKENKIATAQATETKATSTECKTVEIQSPIQRRSTRELKKRQVPMERTRVRYDMELVPAVKRNRVFLDKFPLWASPKPTVEDNARMFQIQQQSVAKQQMDRQQKLLQSMDPSQLKQPPEASTYHPKEPMHVSGQQNGVPPGPTQHKHPLAMSPADIENASVPPTSHDSPELIDDEVVISPFAEDTSVIWVPKQRSEWEDCVMEMTAVCTSASLRRSRGKTFTAAKPFHAPLSKEYIRDRVDIDDPLNGYQIRHKSGGWLQGFILWTNFTTWTHYFKWDSSHAMSGIPTMSSSSAIVDTDGSLAAELESMPRAGDPFEGGVVFQAVAEISLVGGLGCGEYMLRMALEDIRSRRSYKFVVLQATDASKTFYERFGFVRVGAICRYERRDKVDPAKPGVRPDTPIMGYRHWTHPNESDTSLQKHGGPSYMMCLRLPDDDESMSIPTPFLDEMMKLEVPEKPIIHTLGGGSTPHPNKARRGSLDSSASVASTDGQPARRKPSRFRRGSNNNTPETSANTLPQSFDQSSPPVLPVLRGTSFTTSPASNVANAPGDIVPAEASADLKRAAQVSAVERSSKKRRVSVSDNPTDAQEFSNSGRKPPRDRSDLRSTPSRASASNTVFTAQAKKTPARQQSKSNETASSKKKASAKRSTPRRNSGQLEKVAATPATTQASASKAEKTPEHGRSGPMKQKVKSYPRDRVHFYNKVVRPKKGKKTENFFVLHYDETKQTIRIIPMEARGVLSGKRAGRPRFQAVMTNFDREAKTVRCADYDIVRAFMVMKTPVVASEAWDILDA